MLNKDTIEILQQMNKITNSVILKYPKTVAISESQDIQMLLDLSVLDPDSFEPIGLKDSLCDLLGLIKLFPDSRNITYENNTININSDDANSTYITTNLALMDVYDKPSDQFDKTNQAPSVCEFHLSVSDIKRIKSSSGVLKDLSEVIFTSRDGDMVVSLGATNRFNARSNTYSINKPDTCSKEFELKIPVDNFKKLPDSEYTFKIKYNSTQDSYRIILSSDSLEGMEIMMSVKV